MQSVDEIVKRFSTSFADDFAKLYLHFLRSSKNIPVCREAVKLLSVALMFACLCFLTSLNYFLYPSRPPAAEVIKQAPGNSKSDIPASVPGEEKSSSQVSLSEEFLHDPNPVIAIGIEGQRHLHDSVHSPEVLAYHGELLTPPPENC